MLIISGLVGPKARPQGVVDGQQVNIPVLLIIRQKLCAFYAGKVVPPQLLNSLVFDDTGLVSNWGGMDIWLQMHLV